MAVRSGVGKKGIAAREIILPDRALILMFATLFELDLTIAFQEACRNPAKRTRVRASMYTMVSERQYYKKLELYR